MAFEKLSEKKSVKFEKQGDVFEGYYIGSLEFEGKYGPTTKYGFVTAKGERKDIIGQKFLKGLLPDAVPGLMTRVTFTGYKPSGKGNPTKTYEVAQDPDNVKDVSEYSLADEYSNVAGDTYQNAQDDYSGPTANDDNPPDEIRPQQPRPPRNAAPTNNMQNTRDLIKGGRRTA